MQLNWNMMVTFTSDKMYYRTCLQSVCLPLFWVSSVMGVAGTDFLVDHERVRQEAATAPEPSQSNRRARQSRQSFSFTNFAPFSGK